MSETMEQPTTDPAAADEPDRDPAPAEAQPAGPTGPSDVERFTILVTERRHRVALLLRWNSWRADHPSLSLPDLEIHKPNLRDADLRGIDFRGCCFPEALCNRTDFRGANLHGVAFRGADLCDADFSDADIGGADFRWARRGTQEMFDAARGDAATKLPEHISRPAHWPASEGDAPPTAETPSA